MSNPSQSTPIACQVPRTGDMTKIPGADKMRRLLRPIRGTTRSGRRRVNARASSGRREQKSSPFIGRRRARGRGANQKKARSAQCSGENFSVVDGVPSYDREESKLHLWVSFRPTFLKKYAARARNDYTLLRTVSVVFTCFLL